MNWNFSPFIHLLLLLLLLLPLFKVLDHSLVVHLLLRRANPKVVWNVLQSKLLICLISSFQFFSFMSLFTKKMSALFTYLPILCIILLLC